MIDEVCLHSDFTNPETHFLQFFKSNVARHFLHADWKIGALHLIGEGRRQPFLGTFVAENSNLVARVVGRDEERKPLDMISVGVGQ